MKKFGLVIMMMALVFTPAFLYAGKKSYDKNLAKSLAGKFLLQVEDRGKVWYVSPKDNKRYEIRFDNIVEMSSKLGHGIKHEDITKIPIKVVSLGQFDDSDGDEFYDRDEALRGFDPYSAEKGKVKIDEEFTQKQLGKIFLEVDGNGRLWYVDMEGERWNLEWYKIMEMLQEVSLGISNVNLNKIEMGEPLKSVKPDKYVSCRDSIDCMVAASSQCINAGGWTNSSYFFDDNKLEMNVNLNYDVYVSGLNNERCNLQVMGNSIYPELENSYYWDTVARFEENGYSQTTLRDVLQSKNIYRDSIDETFSYCIYSTDVYVNLFKELKTQGVKVFDAFFQIPESGEHACYDSRYYGYSNPGLANEYDRTFYGLSKIYADSIMSNIQYYSNQSSMPTGDHDIGDAGMTEQSAAEARTQRNITRRENMNAILAEAARLCAAGTTTLTPIESAIENTYFVNIDDVNADLNLTTSFPSILDPVDVGICSTEAGGCEYTLMLDQTTKKFDTCNPYILYKIENDDDTRDLSCRTKTQTKEGITDVNACK